MERPLYVVAYDVADDRTRSRIASVLEGFGERVQQSVFECRLTDRERAALHRRLQQVGGASAEVSIRVYRLCARCTDQTQATGGPPLTDPPPGHYLV